MQTKERKDFTFELEHTQAKFIPQPVAAHTEM